MNWEARHREMINNGSSGSMKLFESYEDYIKDLKDIIPDGEI